NSTTPSPVKTEGSWARSCASEIWLEPGQEPPPAAIQRVPAGAGRAGATGGGSAGRVVFAIAASVTCASCGTLRLASTVGACGRITRRVGVERPRTRTQFRGGSRGGGL